MALKDYLDLDDNLSPQKLMQRFQRLLQVRRLWEPILQEIANYIIPNKNDIIVRKAPGVRRTEKLFDSTAIFAAELLAASINGTLTTPYARWFSLQLDDPELNEDGDIRKWLDNCAEKMRSAFNNSNFQQESHEGYQDIVDFGTMFLLFEEKDDDPGAFMFHSVEFKNVAIAEDAEGRVNCVFRSFPLSREAITQKWPDAVKSLEEFKAATGNYPDEPMEVVHAVVPSAANKKPTKLKKPWASVYFLTKTKTILEREGYHEFPYLVPRWSKITGETYGRGRGHTALPDVKTLNKMVEMELRALGKAIDPPIKAKGGDVIGQVRLNRGGVTTVRDMDGVAPLFEGINYQPVNLKIQELKEAVKKMFYADQLQMPDQTPQMTATEVNVRYELMQRVLGPTLGRLESEYLDPMVTRAFKIMQRAGKFDPPPAKLLEAQSKNPKLNTRYEGPLQRAQKSGDVAAVQQLEQTFEPLLPTNPNLLTDNIDLDGIVRHTAEVLGIPSEFIKDAEEVEQAQQERQQQQQQEQQMAQAHATADAAGKAAPMVKALHGAPEAGSVAQQMMGGQQQGGNEQAA